MCHVLSIVYEHDTPLVQRRVVGKTTLSLKNDVYKTVNYLHVSMSQVTHVTLTRKSLLWTVHQPGRFPSLLSDGYPYYTLAVVVPI